MMNKTYKINYITEEFMEQTEYKCIHNSYNRDEFSVLEYDGGWWLETRGLTIPVYKLICKEMRRLYPDAIHIW